MNMKKGVIIASLIILSIIPVNLSARECTVCHSKNPKMVKMHAALGFKDCSKCHSKMTRISFEEQKAMMFRDERCIGCHVK